MFTSRLQDVLHVGRSSDGTYLDSTTYSFPNTDGVERACRLAGIREGRDQTRLLRALRIDQLLEELEEDLMPNRKRLLAFATGKLPFSRQAVESGCQCLPLGCEFLPQTKQIACCGRL